MEEEECGRVVDEETHLAVGVHLLAVLHEAPPDASLYVWVSHSRFF